MSEYDKEFKELKDCMDRLCQALFDSDAVDSTVDMLQDMSDEGRLAYLVSEMAMLKVFLSLVVLRLAAEEGGDLTTLDWEKMVNESGGGFDFNDIKPKDFE